MGKILAILILCVARTIAHRNYQTMIPNGDDVPNPCNPGDTWGAVGHMAPGSNFHQRNPFGRAFSGIRSWTPQLCQQDSDGDGKSNGEELGDPECTWRPGTIPLQKATGHPGICEPVGSARCAAQAFSCGGATQPRMPPGMAGLGMPQFPQSPFQQPPSFQQPRLTFQQPQFQQPQFQQPGTPFRPPQSPFQSPVLTQMQPRPQMPFQQAFPPQMQMQPQGFPPQMQGQPQSFAPPPTMQSMIVRGQQPVMPQMMMPPGAMQPGFPQMPMQVAAPTQAARTATQQQAERSQSWFGQGRFADWFSNFFSQNRPNGGGAPNVMPTASQTGQTATQFS